MTLVLLIIVAVILAILELQFGMRGRPILSCSMFVLRMIVYSMISYYLMVLALAIDIGYFVYAKIVHNVKFRIAFKEKPVVE